MPKGFFPGSMLESSPSSGSRLPLCGKCGYLDTCLTPKMEPTGEGRRGVLIVGEAPGREEDEKGIQFIGKAGDTLRSSVGKIDIERDCWKTNAMICRPPDNKLEKKKIPYCRPNLTKTVEELNPRVIILLGGPAIEQLLRPYYKDNLGGITKWAGFQIPSPSLNAWVCPTFHPSFINREHSPALERLFKRHLKRAFSLKKRPWEDKSKPNYSKLITKVHEHRRAARYIRQIINKGGWTAFDFETNMLKPDHEEARIVSCAICWQGKKVFAYPWHGEAIEATKEYLLSSIPKTGHNIKFEERWARAILKIRINGWKWCGMNGAHVLDNRKGITSLSFQAFVRLGQENYDEHISKYLKAKGANKPNKILEEISLSQLLEYNGMDAVVEYFVNDHQMKEIGYVR